MFYSMIKVMIFEERDIPSHTIFQRCGSSPGCFFVEKLSFGFYDIMIYSQGRPNRRLPYAILFILINTICHHELLVMADGKCMWSWTCINHGLNTDKGFIMRVDRVMLRGAVRKPFNNQAIAWQN